MVEQCDGTHPQPPPHFALRTQQQKVYEAKAHFWIGVGESGQFDRLLNPPQPLRQGRSVAGGRGGGRKWQMLGVDWMAGLAFGRD
jgi:hypothetical protein